MKKSFVGLLGPMALGLMLVSKPASAFTQDQCVSFGYCFAAPAQCVVCAANQQCGPDLHGVLSCHTYTQDECQQLNLCYLGNGACGNCPAGQYCGAITFGVIGCKLDTQCGTASTECGLINALSGTILDCGPCSDGDVCSCADNTLCSSSHCCTPKTCADYSNVQCGPRPDGCGGTLDCGSCNPGSFCLGNLCCDPQTCAGQGLACGVATDLCGNYLNCGSCPGNQKCLSSNSCCQPKTCAQAGVECGLAADGCGGNVDCSNNCSFGKVCYADKCCIPTSCASKGFKCGALNNLCGSVISCGTCPSNQHCDGNHQCAAGAPPPPPAVPATGGFGLVGLAGLLLVVGVLVLARSKKGKVGVFVGFMLVGGTARGQATDSYYLCCDLSLRDDGSCLSQSDPCPDSQSYGVSIQNLPPVVPFAPGRHGVMSVLQQESLNGVCLFKSTILVDTSFNNATYINQDGPSTPVACLSLVVDLSTEVEIADFQFPNVGLWNSATFCYGPPPCQKEINLFDPTINSDKFGSCCGPLQELREVTGKTVHFSAGQEIPVSKGPLPDAGVENYPEPPTFVVLPASTIEGCSYGHGRPGAWWAWMLVAIGIVRARRLTPRFPSANVPPSCLTTSPQKTSSDWASKSRHETSWAKP